MYDRQRRQFILWFWKWKVIQNWNWKNEQLHSSSFDEEIEGSLQMKKIYTNEKYPRLDVNAQNQQILDRNQTFSISNNLLSSFERLFEKIWTWIS